MKIGIVEWVVTFVWAASGGLYARRECAQRVSQLICDGKNFKPIEKRFTRRKTALLC